MSDMFLTSVFSNPISQRVFLMQDKAILLAGRSVRRPAQPQKRCEKSTLELLMADFLDVSMNINLMLYLKYSHI